MSDVLTQLLSSGALLGDSGRDRELFLLARQYQREIGEYFAPLNLELMPDPDLPIFQLRPVPGDCGLFARFNKAETLLVLTLWRIYHDARMEQTVATVVVTANDIWSRLKLYFARIATASRPLRASTPTNDPRARKISLFRPARSPMLPVTWTLPCRQTYPSSRSHWSISAPRPSG